MRVFGSTGFRDAKIADVATEAGVATGTLYNYFSSKEEIFQSILDDGRERLQSMLGECEAVEDPLERLRMLLRVLLGFLEQHGALFAIYMQLGLSELPLKRSDDNCDDEFRRTLLAAFERALVQAGARIRPDHPPELLAAMFGGLLNGMIMRWIDSEFRAGLQSHTDTIMDLFLHGAAAK
jgi:TetR/AcrR family transcriptional regulator, fatty acid metabolism regulator protein